MSSILKALKKLEHDTTNCKPDRMRIDAKILQESYSKKFSSTVVLLIAVVLFVCGGGATYLYMKRSATEAPVPPAITMPEVHKPSRPPVEKGVQPAGKSNVRPPAASPVLPVTKVQNKTNKIPAVTSQPIRAEILAEPPAAKPETPSAAPTPPGARVSGRPKLTINGVAYQEGSNDSMAVINGMTVTSGTIIEGVKVEEILKDRVRFSQGNEQFEIILNKSVR
jgi:general secretion pathway protein B